MQNDGITAVVVGNSVAVIMFSLLIFQLELTLFAVAPVEKLMLRCNADYGHGASVPQRRTATGPRDASDYNGDPSQKSNCKQQ